MTVDDGFAGGVCRCSGCGTIQTVPADATQMVGATSGKVIFEKPGRPGSNLDELGQIVSSSGLVGSGLVSSHRTIKQPTSNRLWKPIAVGGAIALLLAIGVLIGLSMKGSSSQTKSVESNSKAPENPVSETKPRVTGKSVDVKSATVKRSFDEIDLNQSRVVIFVFDRGESTRNYLGDLIGAALDKAEKLGNGKKFQIVFWASIEETPCAPEIPQFASETVIGQVRSELSKIEIARSTNVEPALEIALEGEPTDLVIASGKGWQLDDEFARLVLDSIGTRTIRVHTVAFSSGPETATLRQIASETGGQFVSWK